MFFFSNFRNNLRCSTPVKETDSMDTACSPFELTAKENSIKSADVMDICEGVKAINMKS